VDWLKLHSKRWIFGTNRVLSSGHRGIWADLLALANMTKFRDGTLRHDANIPMTKEYICSILQIPLRELESSLEVFTAEVGDNGKPRVRIWDNGTIELTNFVEYQAPSNNRQQAKTRDINAENEERIAARKAARGK